jgi:hypothetical protein
MFEIIIGGAWNVTMHHLTLLLILMNIARPTLALSTSRTSCHYGSDQVLRSRAANQTSSLLRCLQVSPPVLSPTKSSYTEALMVHTFGYSYGKPFVGQFAIPSL